MGGLNMIPLWLALIGMFSSLLIGLNWFAIREWMNNG